VLGTLVTAPFLTHAGASIISSRDYAVILNETYAADAGVEHAIWRLFDGDLAPQLPNINDSISYSLPNQVNSLTPLITVTKTGGFSGAIGIIADTVIDTLEFDTADCYTPAIVHVSGEVYAIAYRGTDNDGFLKTVTIATDGQIGNSVIDTLEFDTANGYEPDITHVSGNVYAIAYRGTDNDGFLKTVTIAADGQIGNSVIDTLEFDTANCYTPAIVHVSGEVYAIAYRGTDNDGFLKTVTIAADGQIGNSVIDTLEFDTANCYTPAILSTGSDVYAIAYRGTDNDGFLCTIGISSGVATYQIDSVAGGCTITASVQLTGTGIKIASWEVQR